MPHEPLPAASLPRPERDRLRALAEKAVADDVQTVACNSWAVLSLLDALDAGADIGGKLLAAELERSGQYEHAGFLVTYSDDADLCAWKLPLTEERTAEAVFWGDVPEAEAFAWLAAAHPEPGASRE